MTRDPDPPTAHRLTLVAAGVAGLVLIGGLLVLVVQASLRPPWGSMEQVARTIPTPAGFTNSPGHRRDGSRCLLSPSCDLPNVEADLTPVPPRDASCRDFDNYIAMLERTGYRPASPDSPCDLAQPSSSGRYGQYPVTISLTGGAGAAHRRISVLIGDPGGWNW